MVFSSGSACAQACCSAGRLPCASAACRPISEAPRIGVSLLRAYTIRDELVKAGIPIERIELDAYGETLPAVPTADNVPEIHNRRVEVTIR